MTTDKRTHTSNTRYDSNSNNNNNWIEKSLAPQQTNKQTKITKKPSEGRPVHHRTVNFSSDTTDPEHTK